MVKDKRLYNLLEVAITATTAEIKRAFHQKARKLHPDKNVNNPGDQKRDEEFIKVYQAYEILSDETKRQLYDSQGFAGVFPRGGGGWDGGGSSSAAGEGTSKTKARPSPGATPNYGGTSFNQHGYAGASRFEDSSDDFDEEIRKIVEEMLRKRRKRQKKRNSAPWGRWADEESNSSTPLFTREEIEEILRPSFCMFIFWALLDIGINVSAGAAAAAAGAHANGSDVTPEVTRIGALAGLTKSGIVAFVGLSNYLPCCCPVEWLFQLIFSGFLVCLLVTLQVSSMILGQIPGALCGAALIAALPLWAESTNHLAATRNFCWPFFAVPFDALGGVIFALAAKIFGMPICALHSAAAAGAVYGTVTGIPRWIIGCCGCMCVCCMLSQLLE